MVGDSNWAGSTFQLGEKLCTTFMTCMHMVVAAGPMPRVLGREIKPGVVLCV